MNLDTAPKRRKLDASGEIAWEEIARGVALGYRAGWWHRRLRENGHYLKKRFARADDDQKADGEVVLDYLQAVSAVLKTRTEEPAAAPKAEPATYRVRDAARDYLEWYKGARKALDHAEGTIKRYILPRLGDRLLAELTARELREWHHAIASSKARLRSVTGARFRTAPEGTTPEEIRRRRQMTANRNLAVLKALLNRAVQENDLDIPEPWKRVKPFAGAVRARVRFLTEAESRRLLNACGPDFRALAHAALLTGARYGSLASMRVEDFDPERGTIYVRQAKTAASQTHVPLTAEGVALFERATAGKLGHELVFITRTGKPWRRGDQGHRMREASTTAKLVPRVGFHSLKDTFVSHLVKRGVPFRIVSELTGTSVRTLERHYSHLAESDVRAALEAHSMKLETRPAKVRRIR